MWQCGEQFHASPLPEGDWFPQEAWGAPSWAPEQRSAVRQSLRHKRRFCTSFPDVALCRRGVSCAFAHSRSEIRAPLLSMEEEQQVDSALTDEFFMYKYKTLWCPIGVPHEWQTCVYAHNYQDARRPTSIGYGPRPCPNWNRKDTGAEYSQRCTLGLRCSYAHGAKEQLYHPKYFKTVICRDLRSKSCPRKHLCAFFHHKSERRHPTPDKLDYERSLDDADIPHDWAMEFLSPPFPFTENKKDDEGTQEFSPMAMEDPYEQSTSQDLSQCPGSVYFALPLGTSVPPSPALAPGNWMVI